MVFWMLDGRMTKWMIAPIAALILARQEIHWTLDLSIGSCAALAIFACGLSGNLDRWLNFRWLQSLGKISYSLYLIHYPISWIISTLGYELTGSAPVAALCWLLLGLVASIGVAHAMYDAIELPTIRLSHQFKPSRGGRAATATPADSRERQVSGQLAPGMAS